MRGVFSSHITVQFLRSFEWDWLARHSSNERRHSKKSLFHWTDEGAPCQETAGGRSGLRVARIRAGGFNDKKPLRLFFVWGKL